MTDDASLPLARSWYPSADLAGLPGLPAHARDIPSFARRRNWKARPRSGRGGGFEYHFESLPRSAQDALVLTVDVIDATRSSESLWSSFNRETDATRSIAAQRHDAVLHVEQLVDTGTGRSSAIEYVAAKLGVSAKTLHRWCDRVRGADRADWLPLLAPRHVGNTTAGADISPEAWDMFRADYLRPEAPGVAACYDRVCRAAAAHGWTVPSARTFYRRLELIPRQVRLLARRGKDALQSSYPAQQRDRSVFDAMQAVNADGHRFDVFVKWPDGSIGRPMMLAWQDIFSGKLLAHRVDRTEHRDLIRLAFGDVVERFGIPSIAYLDNGRGFASKWLTGGQETRYRFKIRPEDPLGIITALGVEVSWTTPYHGQAKPIERAFRDLCEYVAKHPAFAGAYTGNAPDAKPDNYGAKAIPIDKFLAVLEQEIAAHNARSGRRSPTCRGRSFDETFAESYAVHAVKRATAKQRRLWLLAAEAVSVSRTDGCVKLAGNRYWSEALSSHAGEKIVVRFDPAELHKTVYCYTHAGVEIGEASCIKAAGFNDTTAAREHARQRKRWMQSHRDRLDAEQRMDAIDVAQRLPTPPKAEDPPPPKVVRPMFRGARGDDSSAAARAYDSEFTGTVSELWERHKRETL